MSATRIVDPENRVYAVPFGERWLVRGSTAAAGSIIEWAREALAMSIGEMDGMALEAPIRPGIDPVFVPYLAGARAPLWRPRARGSLIGLAIGTSRADLARALYAGLALSVRHIVETIEGCGAAVSSIRLAGGLSRSVALAQIMVAIGAAHLGAYATIATAARTLAADAATYRPRLARAEADALYARYLRGAGLSVSLVPQRAGPEGRSNGHQSVA